MIEVMHTEQYPVRYVAFDNQGKMVWNDRPKKEGGHEWAVYSERWPNRVHENIESGIYVELVSYQNKALLLDCHAELPNADRTTSSCRSTGRYEDVDRLERLMIAFIEAARAWRDDPIRNPNPNRAMKKNPYRHGDPRS